MAKEIANRDALELADAYWRDAHDYLSRFRTIVECEKRDHLGLKSRRVKAYIDLRAAVETILKSRICLTAKEAETREGLLSRLRKLGHGISALVRDVDPANAPLIEMLEKCDLAPISWRYEAEVRESRSEDERHYYATVGSDGWLANLEQFVRGEVDVVGRELSSFSRIVDARDLSDEILKSISRKK